MSVSTATLAPATSVAANKGSCTSASGYNVALSWTASATSATAGYSVLRGTTSGGPYAQVGSVAGGATTTYTDTIATTGSSNQVYVANNASSTVTPINLSTNSVGTAIGVGAGSRAVAITPDGAYAYVANNGAGTVSQVNLSTGTVTATITVGTGPDG
ncbi:MAG: hypothetical protein E6G27_03900, partial [Actinobacteria bacterium]